MPITVSITETQILTALGNFLVKILPSGCQVIRGQTNRVPQPQAQNYCVMTPTVRSRLATNADNSADALFAGSISDSTMTITSVAYGTLSIGSEVFGIGLAVPTVVTGFGTGLGGTGTYTVSPPQSVGPVALAAGTISVLQPTQVTVQLDVHGPSGGDNAQTISTLFRDTYGVEAFALTGLEIAPLYTSDPKQMPFVNGEMAFEDRWVVDAVMQVNAAVVVPQQFADVLNIELIDVDVRYPPI
jgi:hypothetical protein